MSNTEKLIQQLNEIKEIRKQKEKVVKPAVRIQALKNKLIILANDLFSKKNINAALYRKIELLTYSRTTEKKLDESYNILKNIKRDIGKSNELKIKTKKITSKDFKKELIKTKESEVKTIDKPYEIAFPKYKFYKEPTSEQLNEVSEHFLKMKQYKKGINRDYVPTEKTEHTRKKTFVYDFNGNIIRTVGNYLMDIYKQQKYTFKLTIEFSFLRIKIDYDAFEFDKFIPVEFDLRLASTNTRPDF